MPHYSIKNSRSGHVLGTYEAATPAEALQALARDAGYSSAAESRKAARVDVDTLTVVAVPDPAAVSDLREVLDGVTVEHNGEELTDYSALLLAISQELDGSLPDDGYTFDWTACSRARAQRVFGEARARVTELFDEACSGRPILAD